MAHVTFSTAKVDGSYSVCIGGDTSLRVDTDAKVIEEKYNELLDETVDCMKVFPSSTDYRAIAGLKITTVSHTDLRPAVLQLCVGCRCVLIHLLDNLDLPRKLARLLASPSLLKIVGLNSPAHIGSKVHKGVAADNAAFFGNDSVQWETPWQMAERMGRSPDLQNFVAVQSLAARLRLGKIQRPPLLEEDKSPEIWENWPPPPVVVANLCIDVYELREVGMRIIFG